MNTKITLLTISAVALLAAGCNKAGAPTSETTPPVAEATPPAAMTPPPAMENMEGMTHAEVFEVHASNFKFSPTEIKVKKGDTVTIKFMNDAGKHDWVVDEFKAATKILDAGQNDTITFVADKTGTFEYYCSVGTHRQMGMVGKLIVE